MMDAIALTFDTHQTLQAAPRVLQATLYNCKKENNPEFMISVNMWSGKRDNMYL